MRPLNLLSTSTFHAAAGPSVNFLCIRGPFRQLPLALCVSVEAFINFNQHSMQPRDISSTFRASAGPSGNFHQLSVRPLYLPSTSINILCGCGTFRQLSVHLRDILPTFHASEGPSINFPYVRGHSVNFRQLSMHPRGYPSNFCVSAEHSVIFSKHSVRPWDLPSTSVNLPCIRVTFRLLSSPFCASKFSVNILCGCRTFYQLFLHPRDIPCTCINFPCVSESSVNFPCGRGTFCKLPSIFRAPGVPSIRSCLLSV